jgi:hypothetical protein
VLFCCVALPTINARTSTPSEEHATDACIPTATTSTSATSPSRGYRLLGAHTGLYSSHNIRTLMTRRLWGISTRWLLLLLQSHRVWYHRCNCGGGGGGGGDIILFVFGGRHHCWTAGLLGLGSCESIYCTPSPMQYNQVLQFLIGSTSATASFGVTKP